MSLNILIISPSLLKERTAMHDNVEDKLLYPEIKAAQDLYILPILGSTLYKKILTDIEAGTLAGNYKTLVDDYIIDALCNYVLAELPNAINFQFTNKGVQTKTGEESNAPSISDLQSVVSKYKNRAEHYQKRAIKFLQQNAPTMFTEWINFGNGIDDIRPDTNAFSNPIYLGDEYPTRKKSYSEMYQGNRPNCNDCQNGQECNKEERTKIKALFIERKE